MRDPVHSGFLLRAVFLSLAIYLCTLLLSAWNIASGWEIRIAETFLPFFEQVPRGEISETDFGIRSFMFTLGEPDDNQTAMTQIIAAVRELKRRGVKATFVSVPEMLFTDRNARLVNELSGLGNTILWENLSLSATIRKTVWLNPPLKQLHVNWGANTGRVENVRSFFGNPFPYHLIATILPNAVRNSISREPVEDIVLKCVRMIKGYSDSLQAVDDGTDLILGDVVLPLDTRGITRIRMRHPAFRQDLAPFSATYGLDGTKELRFDGMNSEGRYVSSPDLSFLQDDLHGKIVFVQVRRFSDPLWGEQYPGFLPAMVEAILTGQTLRTMREWTTSIALLVLMVSASLCFFFPPLPAFLLNAALALCSIILHLYSYASGHLVFEIQYALFVILLSVVSMPVFKLAWEVKTLKHELTGVSIERS